MTAAPLLSVSNLSKSFGGVDAIKDVSFSIRAGTVTALIGPNGAGKTTLFNLITQIFPASSGAIEFAGRSLAGMTAEAIAERGLIRAFQSARVFPGMTVLENVQVGAHRLMRGTLRHFLAMPAARREERAVRARAEALLDVAGLLPMRDRAASTLPMGAQKLLEILRALMAGPVMLLLDEPAAGLNDTETAELMTMLRAIRASDITLLVVEHNMSLVMGVADQIIVLDAGRLIAAGKPAEIRANKAVIEAYLGREG
jgi:branched-chain amino acid transport system ATP-binding protein